MKVINNLNISSDGSPRVLVAPLDWGLGHATRCIPVVRELLALGCEVIIAAEGAQKNLLQLEFPGLKVLELRGYHIRYSRNRLFTLLRLVAQIPKILIRIKAENTWLRGVSAAEKLDAVLSDNRYGLHLRTLYSVLITHQLRISFPGSAFAEARLQKLHYRLIEKFDACWIPDTADDPGLAGKLSHPAVMPNLPVHYIGTLSRFNKSAKRGATTDLLIILSGPEPQRSMLERKILNGLAHFNGKATLIRGLPGEKKSLPGPASTEIFNHATADELNGMMLAAGLVIGRSGYSTVMDLVKMGKRSILIPTPGQTEQEYLGKYLMQKKIALCVDQQTFRLEEAVQRANHFSYHMIEDAGATLLDAVLKSFVQTIRSSSSSAA